MKQRLKQLLTILLAVAFVNALSIQTVMAADIATRQTDVTTPGTGNSLVTIRGSFFTVSKETVLNRINEIRREACEQGVPNPETNQPLTMADYKPIRWSSVLEMIAQTRAAEASVLQDHQRPNGTICFTCQYDGQQTWAEDLAWNWSGMMEGIEQWYEEKADWVNQNSGAVTGHYTSMINPGYQYVALGCFRLQSGGWYAVSGEFSFKSGLDETQVGVFGQYDQVIEVPTDRKGEYEQYSGKEEVHTHSLVKTNAKSPTCTEAGNIAYWTCSTCDKRFSDQNGENEITGSVVIPATGHDWGEWVVSKPATESEEGEKQRVCRNDPTHKETQTIPKQLHTHTMTYTAAVEATCTEAGNIAYWTCSTCDKRFSDQNGENEISGSVEIPATGHDWGEWVVSKPATESEEGEKKRVCRNDSTHKETQTIPKQLHTHTMTYTAAVAASCADAGNIAYWTCSSCHEVFTDADGRNEIDLEDTVIPATGRHTWDEGTVVAEPSYTDQGLMIYYCTVCGTSRTVSIPTTEGDPEPESQPTQPKPISTTKLSSVKVKKTTATVKWKRNTTGSGYQLQYSTDKAFRKNVKLKTIKSNKTVKATVKGLKKGKTYYFRIRTTKGNSYSGWSGVKKATVKK